jgi:bifunctional non-homologous end joining protein LigD
VSDGASDRLEPYSRRRPAGRSPEPAADAPAEAGAPRFVVQRHSARSLHYDLRLERDGVLASWAVPRGLPTFPGRRRLAVHTEDHPLAYLDFEGVIPAGEYGAGRMDVYDRGPYETVEEKRDGGLTVRLQGARLRGLFTLVPARLDGLERNWLLLRKREPGEPEAAPPDLPRYEPMLATPASAPPRGAGWLHEVKWDGFRALARLDDGDASLWSRSGLDYATRFAAVHAALGRALLTFRCVVDGEICALDEHGRPTFGLLQNGGGTLIYQLFDLLELDGERLLERPLAERRELLAATVDEADATVRVSRTFDDGEALFEAVLEQGLEGVVSKRLDSTYGSGRRSRAWVKAKARRVQVFAIAGYVRGEGARARLGSLVLAARSPAGLVYVGQVGSGLAERDLDELLAALAPLRLDKPALLERPADPRLRAGRVTWVEPQLACRVELTEWTADGRLRAPVYRGLAAVDDVAELPQLEHVAAPDDATGRYYERVAWALLPHLHDRAVDGAPLASVEDLLARVARRGSELHVALARLDAPAQPDLVAFELSPRVDGGAREVALAARHLRDALAGVELAPLLKTAGGGGLHVVVPIGRGASFAQARTLAAAVAAAVARAYPSLAEAVRIELAANDAEAALLAPYSLTDGGRHASCPLSWDEADDALAHPELASPDAVLERLERLGDLFAPALEGGRDIRPLVGA